MAIQVISAVLKRYPATTPAEKLLAVHIADHAHADGTGIFVKTETLAAETALNVRTVQRHLSAMLSRGWLQIVGASDGRFGQANRYRISAEWLQNLPVRDVESDKLPPTPRVAKTTRAVSKLPPVREPTLETLKDLSPIPPSGAQLPSKTSRATRASPLTTFDEFIAGCRKREVKPIPAEDPVFGYCDRVGIGHEVLEVHWHEFKTRRAESSKRQRDWRQTFRNSVRDNWYRLWFLRPGLGAQLTTQGLQAQAVMRASGHDAQPESNAGVAVVSP